MIRAVVFDAVGTLIYPVPGVAEVYARVAKVQRVDCSVADVRARFHRALDADGLLSDRTDELAESARWQRIVAACLPDVPDPTRAFDELWTHFARPEAWSLFPDVLPSLSTLEGRGLSLAVASNFDSRLHSVLGGHPDLRERFDLVLTSTSIGWRKPSAGFFRAIAEHLKRPAAEILYVGDDTRHDVEAPRNHGMHALRIDRTGEPSDGCYGLAAAVEYLAKITAT